ncbi:MAG: hypothetical protein JO329_20230 [Planctomycetaceae bacterium]|nr:hypothetical protein [Planctomycetaceae bacterium]
MHPWRRYLSSGAARAATSRVRGPRRVRWPLVAGRTAARRRATEKAGGSTPAPTHREAVIRPNSHSPSRVHCTSARHVAAVRLSSLRRWRVCL